MAIRAYGIRTAAFVLAITTQIGMLGLAQQTSAAQPGDSDHKLVTTTELVLVPVVVHDNAGAHVSGLTKNDFEVFEAGKRQKIAVFEEVKASTAPATRTPANAGVYTNKLHQDGSPKRVVVIALDELNSPYLDQIRARQQLIQKLVDAIGTGELTALARIDANGVTVIHDFASDPQVLVEGLRRTLLVQNGNVSDNDLNRLTVRTPPPAALAGSDSYAAINAGRELKESFEDRLLARASKRASHAADVEVTLDCFRHIAEGLAGIPGRKSLIWITAAFPVSLNPIAYPADPFSPVLDERAEEYLRRTMQILEDANVAVYPVDIRGLVTLNMGGIDEDVTGRALRQQFGGLSGINNPAQFRLEAMRSVAAVTGGLAFYNKNQIAEGVRDAIVDSSQYYMLGYYRSQKGGAMQWLPIKVKVHKNDVHIRSRSAVYIGKPPDSTYNAELINAINSPWDYTGVPVSVRWAGTPAAGAEGTKKAGFEIRIDGGSVRVANDQLQLQYAAAVKTDDGKLITRWQESAEGPVTAKEQQQIAAEGVTYRGALSVKPGKYLVRFVVRDNTTGRMGSVVAPLTVD